MGRLAIIFLVFAFAAAPGGWALAQTTGNQEASSEEDERRVRRLGDVVTDEYELDLSVPSTTRVEPEEPEPTFDLGDPELEERLETALGILAIRQGDAQAKEEVDIVLDEVLRRADRRMESGDLEGARDLLNTVRLVEPNKQGLGDAWSRLAEIQRPPEPVAGSSMRAPEPTSKSNQVTTANTYDLPNPAQAERLDQLLSMLAARPGNQATLSELDGLLDDLLAQSRVAMADGDFTTAASLLSVVRSVNPRKRGLAETVRLFQQTTDIDEWLESAREAERQGALVEPRLESAYYWYRRVLAVDIDNQEALRGLRGIQQVMVVYALDAAQLYDFELSDAWLTEASAIIEDQSAVIEGQRQIQVFRDETASGIEEEVLAAIAAGDKNLAEFKLIDLIAFGGYEARVAELRALMTREENYGAFEPGEVIRDGFTDGSGEAPAVVVITSGSFVMGSRENERDRSESEGPQHRVTFERGFALGLHEVTVGEFGAFVLATGYRTDAERGGGTSVWDEEMGQLAERSSANWRHDYMGNEAADTLPVLHVSWEDAQAYVEWLSAQTEQRYRLPSEAEFEYALRAGTRSPYWWGENRPTEEVENLAGQDDRSTSGRRFSNYFRGYGDGHFGPSPAALFDPNDWGVHDLAGNVSEWTQDCWHSSYVRAPADGSAWENPGCARRVVRGGYWASAPKQVRSAARISAPPSLRTPQVGFRVARDLW